MCNVCYSSQTKFERLEAEVKEMNGNKETLKRNLLDLIELQHILEKTQIFFEEVRTYIHVHVHLYLYNVHTFCK